MGPTNGKQPREVKMITYLYGWGVDWLAPGRIFFAGERVGTTISKKRRSLEIDTNSGQPYADVFVDEGDSFWDSTHFPYF